MLLNKLFVSPNPYSLFPIVITLTLITPAFSAEAQTPVESLQEILKGDDFGKESESWGIRLRGLEEKEIPKKEIPSDWIDFFSSLMAKMLRVFAVLAAAALITAALVFAARYKIKRRGKKIKPQKNILTAAALSEQNQNAKELLNGARAAFYKKHLRKAWSLLFSAAAAALKENGITIPEGATEKESARIVKMRGFAGEKMFASIADARIDIAYRRRDPQTNFEESAAFCDSLIQHNMV